MSNDQSFKNLILEYPRASLEFFAGVRLPPDAAVEAVRQEMLQEHLGSRYRELDVPLLVRFADGRREFVVFDLEQHTDPADFSIHRIAHYCLDLAVLFETDHVVPVVIFLRRGRAPDVLVLGDGESEFLRFRYVRCDLPALEFERYRESTNLVARLNLTNMAVPEHARIDAYDAAFRGLSELEPDSRKREKYRDFIDQYAGLDEAEWLQWRAANAKEAKMGHWRNYEARLVAESKAEGVAEGIAEGKAEGKAEGRAEGQLAAYLRLVSSGRLSAADVLAEVDALVASGELPPTASATLRSRLGLLN